MKKILITLLVIITTCGTTLYAQEKANIWMKYEISFTSDTEYANPLYNLRNFYAEFTSPSGRVKKINGFWDGNKKFKIRFAPDETGIWEYTTTCSETNNKGLHGLKGSFECVPNNSQLDIYKRGSISKPKGIYHLSYSDGTPFLFVGCTAWNGALKSTQEEWDTYLKHRVENNYNVIQLVTTQWRGGDKNSLGQIAYNYGEELTVNPDFFQHMDQKIDRVNEYGLVAAPVILWALPFGEGRQLSPGYSLPLNEAVILAKYIVARYGGNQVIWLLGGDGQYAEEYEQRWLEIGRRVFKDNPPGVVAQHPLGRLWIGDNHKNEDWLDVIGYQSSHSNKQETVDWINKGPIATRWDKVPAKPIINMEPNYEEIYNIITDEDVRNASYWSVFAAPIAGITYGANGIWPWIREGEKILNHSQPKHVSTWRESIDFPGSMQIGYMAEFLKKFDWWNFFPANELLAVQPGDKQYNHFISVTKSIDNRVVLVYIPKKTEVKLFNPMKLEYSGQWYNPVNNGYSDATITNRKGLIKAISPDENDYVLILKVK